MLAIVDVQQLVGALAQMVQQVGGDGVVLGTLDHSHAIGLIQTLGTQLLHVHQTVRLTAAADAAGFTGHDLSAFCNAGITIFPAGMEQVGVANSRAVQAVMILLVLIGTVGFGVYLEGITRLKARLQGKVSAKRWSTNSWLVIRVMLIVLVLGTLGLTLLAAFEPSTHQAQGTFNVWESLWNAVGRSAGFALSDIGDYGPVYQLFLAFLMFVGGNPAGTGGGVYAPVLH